MVRVLTSPCCQVWRSKLGSKPGHDRPPVAAKGAPNRGHMRHTPTVLRIAKAANSDTRHHTAGRSRDALPVIPVIPDRCAITMQRRTFGSRPSSPPAPSFPFRH